MLQLSVPLLLPLARNRLVPWLQQTKRRVDEQKWHGALMRSELRELFLTGRTMEQVTPGRWCDLQGGGTKFWFHILLEVIKRRLNWEC